MCTNGIDTKIPKALDDSMDPKSGSVHHSQMLSKAAVMHDAKAIRKRITCLNRRSARPRRRPTAARKRKPSTAVRTFQGAEWSPLPSD